MIAAMVVAMLYRLDDHTGHHAAKPATPTGTREEVARWSPETGSG
jgi:hypothetical protein